MLSKELLTPSGNPEEDFLLRNAEALQKIAIFADLSEGFTVGFVEVNLERDRNFAIRALESSKDNHELQWISLHFDDPDLHYLIATITDSLQKVELIPNRKIVLLISGLEKTIGGYGEYPPLLSNLNIARDTYGHKLPYPILFLLPSYAMTRFARFAPDFWAWKSIEVRLQSDIPAPERAIAEMIVIPDEQKIIPVSQDRFDLLYGLLTEYPQPTLTRADLLNQLGQAYKSHVDYAKAERAYQESLKIYSAINQADRTPAVLNNLASIYESQGRYKEAELFCQRSLVLSIELFGNRHPNVASSMNNLAGIYSLQGKYEEAEPLYQKSLALRQELLGDSHFDIAVSLNNFASSQYLQKKYEQAEPLYQKALSMMQENLGDSHPFIASALNNIASLYRSQKNYEQAEAFYQKALSMRKDLLGDRHPDVATSLNNLAVLYCYQNRYDEAKLLFLQSLEIREAILGSDHPDTQNTIEAIEFVLANLTSEE
jgi:tetratricopeptide (TPR) repeat protein